MLYIRDQTWRIILTVCRRQQQSFRFGNTAGTLPGHKPGPQPAVKFLARTVPTLQAASKCLAKTTVLLIQHISMSNEAADDVFSTITNEKYYHFVHSNAFKAKVTRREQQRSGEEVAKASKKIEKR